MLGDGVFYCVAQLSCFCLTILELLKVVIMKVLETELVGFGKTKGVALTSDNFMCGFPFFP